MSIFGERLKLLRIERKMTQAQLGSIFDVAQQTIGKWEKGVGASPDPETIVKIAEFFSVTTDYLLGRNDKVIDNVFAKNEPTTAAAHTSTPMTPELEIRIQELIKEAFEKYGKR